MPMPALPRCRKQDCQEVLTGNYCLSCKVQWCTICTSGYYSVDVTTGKMSKECSSCAKDADGSDTDDELLAKALGVLRTGREPSPRKAERIRKEERCLDKIMPTRNEDHAAQLKEAAEKVKLSRGVAKAFKRPKKRAIAVVVSDTEASSDPEWEDCNITSASDHKQIDDLPARDKVVDHTRKYRWVGDHEKVPEADEVPATNELPVGIRKIFSKVLSYRPFRHVRQFAEELASSPAPHVQPAQLPRQVQTQISQEQARPKRVQPTQLLHRVKAPIPQGQARLQPAQPTQLLRGREVWCTISQSPTQTKAPGPSHIVDTASNEAARNASSHRTLVRKDKCPALNALHSAPGRLEAIRTAPPIFSRRRATSKNRVAKKHLRRVSYGAAPTLAAQAHLQRENPPYVNPYASLKAHRRAHSTTSHDVGTLPQLSASGQSNVLASSAVQSRPPAKRRPLSTTAVPTTEETCLTDPMDVDYKLFAAEYGLHHNGTTEYLLTKSTKSNFEMQRNLTDTVTAPHHPKPPPTLQKKRAQLFKAIVPAPLPLAQVQSVFAVAAIPSCVDPKIPLQKKVSMCYLEDPYSKGSDHRNSLHSHSGSIQTNEPQSAHIITVETVQAQYNPGLPSDGEKYINKYGVAYAHNFDSPAKPEKGNAVQASRGLQRPVNPIQAFHPLPPRPNCSPGGRIRKFSAPVTGSNPLQDTRRHSSYQY